MPIFKINTKMNDKDYLEFNYYTINKTEHGKKNMRNIKILYSFVFLIVYVWFLILNRFSFYSFFLIIPLGIALLATVLPKNFFGRHTLKIVLSVYKKGKKPYSPESTIEFYEDSFVETTENSKQENKYESIYSVCVFNNNYIYIYINPALAYIFKISDFKSVNE